MARATLVVMAAGIGSRFGSGIKQLAPVGPNGEIIIDYSIYDAIEAGFDKVVFVIRKDLEEEFRSVIGDRISQVVDVSYAYQEVEDIPLRDQVRFRDRKKPWGTGQAILSCRDLVDSPFLVINADDYYGKQAFQEAYAYLTKETLNPSQICMVGFVLKNTLSDNGAVTRGICEVDENQMLTRIVETKKIAKDGADVVIQDPEGNRKLDPDSPVSMNMWGLYPNFFDILEDGFASFLADLKDGDQDHEYLLPDIIGDLLKEGRLSVKVLQSEDRWFGVTFKEDQQDVEKAVKELIKDGAYPVRLYE